MQPQFEALQTNAVSAKRRAGGLKLFGRTHTYRERSVPKIEKKTCRNCSIHSSLPRVSFNWICLPSFFKPRAVHQPKVEIGQQKVLYVAVCKAGAYTRQAENTMSFPLNYPSLRRSQNSTFRSGKNTTAPALAEALPPADVGTLFVRR